MSGFGERLNQRQKGFKKATDAEEARRKREDAAVQLRKQVKEEALLKKRMVNENSAAGAPGPFGAMADTPAAPAAPSISPHAQSLQNLPAMVQAVTSDDPDAVFTATQQFRKLLSIETNPPINEVIQAGIMPRFIQLLKEVSRPQLQFEAAWVLTNVASGTADQTRVVVEHGALPLFVELLQSPNDDVREQAVWALGNIAGDCPNFRDLVLQSGGLVPIMHLTQDTSKASLTRNATWTLSNLCRGKPPPPLEWVTPALPAFAQLLQNSDVEVLTDASWAMSYLSDGSNDRISAVIQSGVSQRLVELLGHPSQLVQTPALRACGNVVTGNEHQTEHMLKCGILQPLHHMLSHTKKVIRKEACWTISNITAGTVSQIQEVCNSGLIAPVVHLMLTADFDIKKEAAWAISNATAGGSPAQIEYLVSSGAVKPLCELLTCSDSKIVCVAIDALDNILKMGAAKQQELGLPENPCRAFVEQAEGEKHLEELQTDANEDVYGKAVKVLTAHWPTDEEDGGDQEIAAGGNVFGTAEGFKFAMPQGGFNFGA